MQKKSTQDKCFYLIDDGYNFNEQVLIDFLVQKLTKFLIIFS